MSKVVLVGVVLVCLCPILISTGLRSDEPDSRCSVSECGKAQIDFPKKGNAASTWIRFTHEYKKPPLVLAGQCGTSGAYVFVMAENLSRTTCRLTAWMPDKVPGYKCDIAYIVIGEIEEK